MQITKKQAISFRIDIDLQEAIQRWLITNKGINFTMLANLAIRQFISKSQVLKPVEIVKASTKEVMKSTKKMLHEHSDAMDKLK